MTERIAGTTWEGLMTLQVSGSNLTVIRPRRKAIESGKAHSIR